MASTRVDVDCMPLSTTRRFSFRSECLERFFRRDADMAARCRCSSVGLHALHVIPSSPLKTPSGGIQRRLGKLAWPTPSGKKSRWDGLFRSSVFHSMSRTLRSDLAHHMFPTGAIDDGMKKTWMLRAPSLSQLRDGVDPRRCHPLAHAGGPAQVTYWNALFVHAIHLVFDAVLAKWSCSPFIPRQLQGCGNVQAGNSVWYAGRRTHLRIIFSESPSVVEFCLHPSDGCLFMLMPAESGNAVLPGLTAFRQEEADDCPFS
ncbi:hypothetical protein F5I97DRAFT_248147 [Phlebopus sp. FC_14]|nr:hypothetical protein F5I97DRAFT_248147 [Phlebopus sp. FC_14]